MQYVVTEPFLQVFSILSALIMAAAVAVLFVWDLPIMSLPKVIFRLFSSAMFFASLIF